MKIYIIAVVLAAGASIGSYFFMGDIMISAIIGAGIIIPVILYKLLGGKIRLGKQGEYDSKVARLLNREQRHLYFEKDQTKMSGDEFEIYTGIIFRLLGFQIHHTAGGSSDYGVDLIAIRPKDSARIAIQCKKYVDTAVDNQVINVTDSSKKIYKCQLSAVVTTSRFTYNAIMAAATCNVMLVDGDLMVEKRKQIDEQKNPKLAKLGDDIKPSLAEIKPGSSYAKLIAKNKASRSRKKKK